AAALNNSFDEEASGSDSVIVLSESASETVIASTDPVMRMDEMIRKLNKLLAFLAQFNAKTQEIKTVQDAMDFDVQSYLNACKTGLNKLIDEQVQQQVSEKLASHAVNVLQLMEWCWPEINEVIRPEDVFQRLSELLATVRTERA
ncbi:unnamed protein product, partial [Gongylonema pulchrum]|uniref:VHS domain-containing protein n=1 Tax=Gongylonema pulchrum TaxID=637853 RepID=A0A183CVB6_9BILA